MRRLMECTVTLDTSYVTIQIGRIQTRSMIQRGVERKSNVAATVEGLIDNTRKIDSKRLKAVGSKNKNVSAASKSKNHPFEQGKKTSASIKRKNKECLHKETPEIKSIPSKKKQLMEAFNEVNPSMATDNDASLVAKLGNWRAPLRQKDLAIFEASQTCITIEPTSSDNIDDGFLSQCEIESNLKENPGDPNRKRGAATRTKMQSTAKRNKQILKTKNLSCRTNTSEFANFPPHSTFINKNNKIEKKLPIKQRPEPCKVTAKKGTLTHLKQRQKRQDYLLQQQRDDEEFDDFFDDTDNPEMANFHKAKYQIPDLFLDSSVTSGSTSFTSCNMSLCSVSQTPPTTEKRKKNTIKKQNGNGKTSMASLKNKKGSCRNKTDGEHVFDGMAFSPRSTLLARFAGDESDGRGLLVSTPTTSGKGGDLGVNLGLAMTPGELLEQSVANRIIYNNKMKRPRKRIVFTSPTPLNQSSHEGSFRYRVINQSGARHLPRTFSRGSFGQSPGTSLEKQAGCLSELPVDYESWPDDGINKTMRLQLSSIFEHLTRKDEGSDNDDYFEDPNE